MDIVRVITEYGWWMVGLGLIGSLVVGAIKTPIKYAIDRHFEKTNPTEAKRKKVENIFDMLVFIGAFLIAVAVAVIHLALMKDLSWETVFGEAIPVWLTQSIIYGMWKKLGIKRILEKIWAAIKKLFVKFFDKNNDGAISFEEATVTIQEFLSGGKLDIKKVLEKAEAEVPGFVNGLISDIADEAGDAGKVNPEEEVEKLKDAVSELPEIVKDATQPQKALDSDVIVADPNKVKKLGF